MQTKQTIQALEWLAEWCELSSAPDTKDFEAPEWRKPFSGIRVVSKVREDSEDYKICVDDGEIWVAWFNWVVYLNISPPCFETEIIATAATPEGLAVKLGWTPPPTSPLTCDGGD